MARIEAIPVEGLGEVEPGCRLGAEIASAATWMESGDVVCVAQKVVSKAEGRLVDLGTVEPAEPAVRLARELDKDPRLVELILRESKAIVRAERGVLITETRGGWICANAGVDASNVPGEDIVCLLPEDPDRSARAIRAELQERLGAELAVVISDSFGRPWRLGQAEVAIGCAGIAPLADRRGTADREGRELTATIAATADLVAAAAELSREKADGVPAVAIRGLAHLVTRADGPGARALQRPAPDDLFR